MLVLFYCLLFKVMFEKNTVFVLNKRNFFFPLLPYLKLEGNANFTNTLNSSVYYFGLY